MKQYLLSVYSPDGEPDETVDLATIMANLARVREEMEAAGAWVFAGGLHPTSTATVVRPQGSDLLITDGPFVEGKEHIGGFTIIKAADLDAALEWARKLAQATTVPIEVRPFRGEAKA